MVPQKIRTMLANPDKRDQALDELGQWVKDTCLIQGTSPSTAYVVAYQFVSGIADNWEVATSGNNLVGGGDSQRGGEIVSERRIKVQPEKVVMLCPHCENGVMVSDDIEYLTYPPSYLHTCAICGYRDSYRHTYPYIDYVELGQEATGNDEAPKTQHLYLDADMTPSEAATMILAVFGPVFVDQLVDALVGTFEIRH